MYTGMYGNGVIQDAFHTPRIPPLTGSTRHLPSRIQWRWSEEVAHSVMEKMSCDLPTGVVLIITRCKEGITWVLGLLKPFDDRKSPAPPPLTNRATPYLASRIEYL